MKTLGLLLLWTLMTAGAAWLSWSRIRSRARVAVLILVSWAYFSGVFFLFGILELGKFRPF